MSATPSGHFAPSSIHFFKTLRLRLRQPLERAGHLVLRRHQLLRVVGQHGRRVEFALLRRCPATIVDSTSNAASLVVEIDVGVAVLEVRPLRVVAADAVVFEDRFHVLFEIDGGESRRAEQGDAGGERDGRGRGATVRGASRRSEGGRGHQGSRGGRTEPRFRRFARPTSPLNPPRCPRSRAAASRG